jgi:branched-chain amino acid transport system substrate-binding protein
VTRGSVRPVILAAVVAMLVGSLSITASAAESTSAAGAPDEARGVTATTITVGGLAQLARYPSLDLGAKARFARANAEGGVHGRTFDYLGVRDDGGTAAGNVQAATALVQQDHVFAVVPVATPDLGAASDLLAQRVPYFGWALSSNFCGTRWGFSFTGCMFPPDLSTASTAWGALVKQMFGAESEGKTAAVVTESTDAGKYFLTTVSAGVDGAGLDVVSATSSLPIPPVADFDELAKQLLTSSTGAAPDAIFVMASYPNVTQLRQAVRGAGYSGVFTDTVEYEPTLVGSATGSLIFTWMAPVESAPGNPAMAQLVADVRAIAPNQPIDQSVLAGYWSADLFIATVKRAGRNLSAGTLVKKANTRFTYEVKGNVGPVRFPAAHDEPVPCGSLVQSTGTAFTVAVPYRCEKVVDVE